MRKDVEVVMDKQINDTLYFVAYATSDNARETAEDKVKRLIMNEPITLQKKAS